MLLRLSKRFLHKFGQNRQTYQRQPSQLQQLIKQKRNLRQKVGRQRQKTQLINQNVRQYYDSIVKISLYMQQTCWKSQYMCLLLNYNQLGFKKISDLVFLNRSSYFLNLRGLPQNERWPTVKIVIALQPKIILTGISQITQFFKQNKYFYHQYDRYSSQTLSQQAHIRQNIEPYLQSLFWHPLLTYQYLFHTNIQSYYDAGSTDNFIYGMLGRNLKRVIFQIFKNTKNIITQYNRYIQSKQKFTQAIKQLQQLYFKHDNFLGGKQPSHADFYLISLLKTKQNSKLFKNYLQNKIGGHFWRYWIKVNNLCQYNKERVTTL